MKYNNIIFLGLCLGLTTYSALSADSVIKISGRVLDYGCTVSSGKLREKPSPKRRRLWALSQPLAQWAAFSFRRRLACRSI